MLCVRQRECPQTNRQVIADGRQIFERDWTKADMCRRGIVDPERRIHDVRCQRYRDHVRLVFDVRQLLKA